MGAPILLSIEEWLETRPAITLSINEWLQTEHVLHIDPSLPRDLVAHISKGVCSALGW